MFPQSTPMHTSPSYERIVFRCRSAAAGSDDERVWIGNLLLALLHDESLAAAALRKLQLDEDFLHSGVLGIPFADRTTGDVSADGEESTAASDLALDDPELFTRITDRAIRIARRDPQADDVGSRQLLLAAAEVSPLMNRLLAVRGVSEADLRRVLGCHTETEFLPVPPEAELHFRSSAVDSPNDRPGSPLSKPPSDPASDPPSLRAAAEPPGVGLAGDPRPVAGPAGNADRDELPVAENDVPDRGRSGESPLRLSRVLDANLNRAREGLRVLEDYCRFISNDAVSMRRLKELRHAVVETESLLHSGHRSSDARLTGRDVAGDAGTTLTLPAEQSRHAVSDIVTANCRRVEESLRSLEEFGKLVSTAFSARMKQLRYECYSIEQQLLGVLPGDAHSPEPAGDASRRTAIRDRLAQSILCVLVTEAACHRPWKTVVQDCLDAGVDVLQLREKSLPDRELLRRARWLTAACRDASALSIINDRPDVARLSNADGVHVGQDELPEADVRRAAGEDRLVGVSTHSTEEADAAVRTNADYLGVGPVFASQTKEFPRFAGLEFVRVAAAEVRRPWFAIGGVTLENIDRVIAAGARRVAATAAVVGTPCPADAAAEFRRRLLAADPPAAEVSS